MYYGENMPFDASGLYEYIINNQDNFHLIKKYMESLANRIRQYDD